MLNSTKESNAIDKLITSTAVPTRELKLEAIAEHLGSFELLCLASGMEALGEIMEHDAQASVVHATHASVVHATHAVLSGGRTAGEKQRARSVHERCQVVAAVEKRPSGPLALEEVGQPQRRCRGDSELVTRALFRLRAELPPNLRNDSDALDCVSGIRRLTDPTMSWSFAKLVARTCWLNVNALMSWFSGLA